MNEDRKTTDLPAWRMVGVPIAVTLAAVMFWMEYYGSVGWWPVILFVIWAIQYAKFMAARRGEKSDFLKFIGS